MIIKHIHIDNFGCFHDFDLELHAGVNILTKPNEFGKTTIIEFIRRIFWGFPDKRRKQLNPYPALNGSGHYGGFLDVVMADGRELRLERRGVKGNLKIIDSQGGTEELDDIASLAGVSENFYRNICAVTIEELTAFSSIDSDEIKNLIYGNNLYAKTFSLSEIQEKLTEKAEVIFKKRGTQNTLKKLADTFAASEERLARVAGNTAAYEKSVLNAEKLEETAVKIKNDLDRLQNEISTCEKFLEVMQTGKKLAEEEKIFASRKVPEPLPELLPPFAGKAPELPPEPVWPEQIPLIPEPDHSSVAARCDHSRAVDVSDADIETAEKWSAELSKNKRSAGIFMIVAVTMLLLEIAAAAMVLGKGGANMIGVVICIVITVPLIVAFCGVIRRQLQFAGLKKIRENMVFRFALNPALESREIAEVLRNLKDLQQQRNEYNECLKQHNARKTELEQLRMEYDLRRKVYDNACAVYARERDEYDKKRLEVESLYRSGSAATAEYESEKRSLALRVQEWQSKSREFADVTFEDGKLEALREEYDSLRRQLEENLRFSGAERREAKLLADGVDCAVELNVREQLRGEMRAAAERYLVLKAAEAVLKKSIERCERERQPELLKNASEWFAGFTRNAYTRIYRQLSTGELRVSASPGVNDKDISELSRGTREQLFLALRLALIAALENSSEPLPIVLDDIMVNFDLKRRQAVMDGVEKFAETRQVLILGCNSI